MTEKTITWVAPMSEADDRGIRWITVKFADGDTGYLGKKDLDTAMEVAGLLEEAVNQVLDFTLEDTGKTNSSGGSRFKITGFGTPGGAATYTAPGVQGGGNTQAGASVTRSRSPEPNEEDPRRSKEEMRRSEALRAAASFLSMSAVGMEKVLEVAEFFEGYLASGSASSAYDRPSTETSASDHQAGAGSESTPTAETVGGGGQSEGEAGCPPHDLDLDVAPKAMRYPCRRCGFWIKGLP